jgi:hypothetical protein
MIYSEFPFLLTIGILIIGPRIGDEGRNNRPFSCFGTTRGGLSAGHGRSTSGVRRGIIISIVLHLLRGGSIEGTSIVRIVVAVLIVGIVIHTRIAIVRVVMTPMTIVAIVVNCSMPIVVRVTASIAMSVMITIAMSVIITIVISRRSRNALSLIRVSGSGHRYGGHAVAAN